MKIEKYMETVENVMGFCDVPFFSETKTEEGWKISIQGHCIADSLFLISKLYEYLVSNEIPFKSGTPARFALSKVKDKRHFEQSKKAMTIYCPDVMDIKDLCEKIYSLIVDYKGWHSIKTPTSYEHYAGGVFFRNDRDSKGAYIESM
jgi:hypothetical protein